MNEAACWDAVLARDARADGSFVYAVQSTGVYCRPSCPSRRPRRENVRFYALPEAAEQQGYRACRRCQPRSVRAADPAVERVREACLYMEARPDQVPTLEELGEHLGISPYHLQRSFKELLGISPKQYADALRMGRLKALLREGESVTGALYEAGFGSSSRLYEKSDARLGMTPATYRRGGEGARIGYTVAESPLGLLLVAATARGVCFVCLGDSDACLEAELHREFPAADLARDDGALSQWAGQVLEYLRGHQPHLDLPLDVRATAFQWRVWEELRRIPAGITRSYREVAALLGQPTAVRAVARACATNPVALVIPCHRVVGSDGTLTGYRWGIGRKQALLEQERGGGRRGGLRHGRDSEGHV